MEVVRRYQSCPFIESFGTQTGRGPRPQGVLFNVLSQAGIPVSFCPPASGFRKTWKSRPVGAWSNDSLGRLGIPPSPSLAGVGRRWPRMVKDGDHADSAWLKVGSGDRTSPGHESTHALGPMSKVQVVAVSSGKGGVGKTNVVVNLAVASARQGRRS